jgi:hypothetical protein
LLASGRILTWNKAKPGGEVARFPELPSIASGSPERGCTQRADAWNAHQPSRDLVPICGCLDFFRHDSDPFFEAPQISEEIRQEAAHRWSEIIFLIAHNARKVYFEDADALTNGNSIFQTKRAHLAN